MQVAGSIQARITPWYKGVMEIIKKATKVRLIKRNRIYHQLQGLYQSNF